MSEVTDAQVVPTEETDSIDAAFLALSPKQQRFIHLYMGGAYTIPKLAQLLELHPNTLLSWLKRPAIKNVIADMQAANTEVVNTQIKAMTLKAIQKLSDLVNSPIDGVALQAVKDILDRSGHKPKQEVNVHKTVVTYEEKMKQIIDSTIIDADYREVE